MIHVLFCRFKTWGAICPCSVHQATCQQGGPLVPARRPHQARLSTAEPDSAASSSDTTEPSCCSGASRWRSWHVSQEIIRVHFLCFSREYLVIICCDLSVCHLTVTISLFRGAGWAAVNMKSWSIDQMCDNERHCESVWSSNKMFCKYCFNTDFLMRQSWNLKIDVPDS